MIWLWLYLLGCYSKYFIHFDYHVSLSLFPPQSATQPIYSKHWSHSMKISPTLISISIAFYYSSSCYSSYHFHPHYCYQPQPASSYTDKYPSVSHTRTPGASFSMSLKNILSTNSYMFILIVIPFVARFRSIWSLYRLTSSCSLLLTMAGIINCCCGCCCCWWND